MTGGPRRIALLTTELAVGGAERCLVNLALRLDRRRFLPTVYSLAPPPPPLRADLVEQLKQSEVPVRFVGVRHARQFLTAVHRLKGYFRDQRPELLQCFLFHANVVGSTAARLAEVPEVVLGIRVADPSRWRQYVEHWIGRRADAITCVSQSVAEFARQSVGLPSDKLIVIPNGVELDRVAQLPPADLTTLGVPRQRRTLLFVGRLDRQKGVDWLLELAPRLLESLPDCDLLLVGDGPLRRSLEEAAAASSVRGRIHFAGWRPDTGQIMRACSMLLLPSRWEGMPNVMLEAMACGLPVVSTRAAGVVELLGDLSSSQTVEFGDSDNFLALAHRIAADATLAEQLGGQNRRRVETYFSIDHMVRSYERLWEALLAERCG